MQSKHFRLGMIGGLASLLLSCAQQVTDQAGAPATADIRYTGYGVPHVKSETFEGAGLGLGYAFAKDNLCVMAEQFVTIRGERSKYFGADGQYYHMFRAITYGDVDNLISDTFYKSMYTEEEIGKVRDETLPEVHKLIVGFVEGYNQIVSGEDGALRPEACRDAAWVTPITEADVYRQAYYITLVETLNMFLPDIVTARPPRGEAASISTTTQHAFESRTPISESFASNAVAFGRDATENRSGLMFSNPHYLWSGSEREYTVHLTVGDDYDVFGGIFFGLPVPVMGFNRDLAWSITYSTDQRYAVYELMLDPKDPTRYLLDGESQEMISKTVSIEMPDGSSVDRTVYETQHGPVLTGGPFEWTQDRAYAIRDVNRKNYRMLGQYFLMGQAQNVTEFRTSMQKVHGLQFSNTISADRYGDAMYTNISVAVDLDEAQIAACSLPERTQGYLKTYGFYVINGAKTECDFKTSEGQRQPGVIAPDRHPFIVRTDYVVNTNDSHWVVNADPDSYLEGYSPMIGRERTERGTRLRWALDMIEGRLNPVEAGRSPELFSPQSMIDVFYESSVFRAETLLPDLLSLCRDQKSMSSGDGTPVDVSAACDILSNWDRTYGVESRSAHVFQEFLKRLPTRSRWPHVLESHIFRVPFDPNDPVHTPRGLLDLPEVKTAFADAVKLYDDNGIALDARYGDVHFLNLDGERVSASGARFHFNLLGTTFQPGLGHTDPVIFGNSYMHAITFDESGPVGKYVLVFGQSTDPESVHSDDQIKMGLSGSWIDVPFTDEAIAADPNFRLLRVEGVRNY